MGLKPADLDVYFAHLFAPARRRYACRATTLRELESWRAEASAVLCDLLGLGTIARQNHGHTTRVTLREPEDCGTYTRRGGAILSEPGLEIPFWMLRPKGAGPFPLAITPHGHTHFGADQYVGLASSQEGLHLIEREERDVAVQAVEHGFLTIAPTTRGFAPVVFPDTAGTDGTSCRSQLIRALLAGRTALGERVWDLLRLLDWAERIEDVDAGRVLVLGNSGGCVLTALLAACDPRVSVAVMNCCFCTFVGEHGATHLCDCNTVPGLMEFGDFADIAGLIAPRPLLVINGVLDQHPRGEVDQAVGALTRIYRAAGAPDHLVHVWADGGCRFYKARMWPLVERAFASLTARV